MLNRLLLQTKPIIFLLPLAAFMLLSVISIIFSFAEIDLGIWDHIWNYIIIDALANSTIVAFYTGVLCWLLAVPSAWIISIYQFPGRAFFSWALALPLAIPPFVISIVYIDLLDYRGFLQSWLRQILDTNLSLWEIRSWWGVSIAMSFSLFPYIYLLTRSAFDSQGAKLANAAKVLGINNWRLFIKIAIPLAAPWWMGGIVLVWMEVFSDFGAFQAFGVDGITSAIYKIWFALYDLNTARQASIILVIFAFSLLYLQGHVNAHKKFTTNPEKTITRQKVSPLTGWTFFSILSAIWLFAFVLPLLRLLLWVFSLEKKTWQNSLLSNLINTLILAVSVAVICCVVGFTLALIKNIFFAKTNNFLVRLANIGYALPSFVLAIGLHLPMIKADNWLNEHWGTSYILQGTIIGTIIILWQKFNNVGYNSIGSSLERISNNLYDVAKTFNISPLQRFIRITLPLSYRGIVVGFLLVFVDVCKELPITLISRPLNWNSLSVKVFEYTSAGLYQQAALPSLYIVIICTLAIFFLARKLDSRFHEQ